MQQMHGIIPQLFDCWSNPVAHLLLLKSSMLQHIKSKGTNLENTTPPEFIICRLSVTSVIMDIGRYCFWWVLGFGVLT